MKKRTLAAALAMVMTLGLASGCGKTQDTASGGDVPTLTWYVPGDKQPDMALVMEEANKIVEPAIGAKIDLQMIDAGAFQEKMTMMMASGEVFDMTFTGAGNDYMTAVEKGGLLDITDMIDTEAPKLREVVRDYAFEEVTVDGRIYGVPNMQILAGKRSLFIPKDIAEEYGLEELNKIKKIDDAEPFLAWAHEKYPDMYPLQIGQGLTNWDFAEYLELGVNNMGISYEDLLDGDGKMEVVWLRDTDIDKHALEKLHDWYQKGYIRKDVLSVTDDSLDVKAGKYIVETGLWKPGAEAEYYNKTGRECVIIQLDFPTLVNGAVNTMISVSRTSKNPEKSLQFIELINTNKELYNLIAFGIEGKHYTKNEEGKIVLNPQSGYFQNASWKFGCVFNALVQEGQDDDVWEQTIALNDSAVVSPLLGFKLDSKPIATEISAVTSISSQYKVMQTGAEDPDSYWTEYLQKVETAGIRKIQEETQRQVDEYLKMKNNQ